MSRIPTTVFTGALGAGKTTLILNLVKQLPDNYKSVWLKNEYGDVNIDSELAKANSIQTKEIMNGCICCVLLGKLGDALRNIVNEMHPSRLIIETAGTAYPYPIINEVNKVPSLKFDGLVTVIDAINFEKFGDKSPLARSQAKYVDLVVVNKVEMVNETQLERVMDEIYDLFPDSPKVQTKDGKIGKELLLGLDSKLVQVSWEQHPHKHTPHEEIETFDLSSESIFEPPEIENYLSGLDSSDFFRIKGIVKTKQNYQLLNYVFGKIDWEVLENYSGPTRVTFMGKGIKGGENIVVSKFLALGIKS